MSEPAASPSESARLRLSYLVTAGLIGAAGFLLVVFTGSFFNRELPPDFFSIYKIAAQIATAVVSFGIFITGWYGYKQQPNRRILALAVIFFAVGLFDFLDALTFRGMPAFLSGHSMNKDATYWIAARLISGGGLLLAVYIPERPLPRRFYPRLLPLAAAAFVVLLIIIESYVPGWLPVMFINGQGATPVKVALEFMVTGFFATTIIVLLRKRVFNFSATVFLQAALLVSIFSELAFTLYSSPNDSYNVMGYSYKAAAYYLILRAVFVSALQQPYLQLDGARRELEEAFSSIGDALASSLELDKTLNLITNLATGMLHTPHALALLHSQEHSGRLVAVAARGLKDPPAELVLENDSMAARVVRNHEPVLMRDMSDSWAVAAESGKYLRSAVAAPILRESTVLGILAVFSESANAFSGHEARLLASFARQAAVAIGNSRLFESELEARSKILDYATRLSILHEIGLSLIRETDQKKLLEMVLRGAGELTFAGVGILLLTDGAPEMPEIVSIYQPAWYQQRCEVKESPGAMHSAVASLISREGGSDVVRLSELDLIRPLPPGHFPMRGLIIATIRDLRGKARGYFLLTDRKGGADFTREDEEVISLLAAQCSVALASAENFEREHYVAETLQTALLPEKPVRDDIEVGLLYRSAAPYAKVGGDFYDFIELDSGRIAIAVGDVCGKGLEAATYTAMIKYMLRAYLGEGMFPGDCLTKLNRAVYAQVSADKFITMGLAVIDTKKGIVNYTSAGHPPPLVCRDGQANPMHAPQSVPLGVLEQFTYLSSQVRIGGACAIFMYTDGLIEARPEGGEPFGEIRVAQAVAGCCCLDAQKVADELLGAAIEYSGGNLRDDIALLVVRFMEGKKKHGQGQP